MGKFNLNTADGIRVELTKQQQEEIEDLYQRVAKNIAREAEKIPQTTSDAMRQQYLRKLQKQIDEQLEKLGKEVQGTITHNMALTAQAMVSANQQALESVGLYIQGAFSHVPDDIVRLVSSGKLYSGNWSLSKAIWGNTQKTQKDINTVIAEGIAQNKSAYAIAKDLEKYVNPSAKKDWDWAKVYPGTSKKVDYNAQRLARTMVSHAYQQSFVRTTQKNPFVTKYKWVGSNSHRICPICAARDGQFFEKDELPLDHPNGMCTFVAVMDGSMVDMADRIADWASGKPDLELDEYARYLSSGVDSHKNKDQTQTPPTPKMIDRLLQSQTDDTSLRSEAQAWWSKLSKGEQNSIVEYTNKSYIWMNKSLREGTSLGAKRLSTRNALQSALSQYSSSKDMVVRRGIDQGTLGRLLGDFSLKNVRANPKNYAGSTFQDLGFLSTSATSEGGFKKQVECRILVPQGSQAPYIAGYSKYPKEQEVLINSGGLYRVLEVQVKEDKTGLYQDNIVVYIEYLGSK